MIVRAIVGTLAVDHAVDGAVDHTIDRTDGCAVVGTKRCYSDVLFALNPPVQARGCWERAQGCWERVRLFQISRLPPVSADPFLEGQRVVPCARMLPMYLT